MSVLRAARPTSRAAVVILIASVVTACGLLPAPNPGEARILTLPAARSSALGIITDQNSSTARQLTSTLLGDSPRAGEHIFVFNDCGSLLASSVAPAQPRQQAPVPPAPLPASPTTFQKARYQRAERAYQQKLNAARRALQNKEHDNLTSWAQHLASQTDSGSGRSCGSPSDLTKALGQAAATFSSLRQSGQGSAPETMAVIGVSSSIASTTPEPSASLQGSMVVVGDFQGTGNAEAGWQASLDQAGARRAVILSPATDNQLQTVVQQGLDGAVTDTLTSVLFGLGQYTLAPSAAPQLQKLLHLLTVTYPRATANIDGYTDNLPAPGPGGNAELSQRRADAVLRWLVANHVAVSRLQVAGYGDTDPVVPNTPTGQQLNRRVVVIIDPATGL